MLAHRTIHRLKQRPHHERRAVALLIATGVVIVLFIGWAYAFFSSIHTSVTEQQTVTDTSDVDTSSSVVVPSTDSTTNADFGQTEAAQ